MNLLLLGSAQADSLLNCVSKKHSIDLTVTEKAVATLILQGVAPKITKESWILAMNRAGDTIVPEEYIVNADLGRKEPREYRFENLRLCGDADSVRVRIYDLSGTDRVFNEEITCTCKVR